MAGGYTLSEGAVRKLAGLVRGGMTEARRGASSPSAVSFDGHALPFTVRWAASEGQSGAWVVWLPSLANLVTFAGTACTISGVAAATSLPAGWYTVANAATVMYLVVTVTDSTGAAAAELSAAPGTAATGETVYNLIVATMSTDATTGAKRVRQYIVGAVALGGGGGASGSITYIKAIRYDAYTHQIQAIAETCNLATGQTTALQVLPNPLNGWIMIPGGQAERAPICECNTGSGDSSPGTGSGS